MTRCGSRAAATSKMEHFVTIVNGFQPLTIIKKRSILDVAAVLDPPLDCYDFQDSIKNRVLPATIKACVRYFIKIHYTSDLIT